MTHSEMDVVWLALEAAWKRQEKQLQAHILDLIDLVEPEGSKERKAKPQEIFIHSPGHA